MSIPIVIQHHLLLYLYLGIGYLVHYLHLHIHETLSYVVPLLVMTRHYKKFKMSAFHRFSSSLKNIAGLALKGYIDYFWIYATSVNI
ncbi:hypothetical protein ACFX2H_036732 [Malus domestica]